MLVWSAKESALKALGVGLRLDTREIEVELPGGDSSNGWHPLVVRCPEQVLRGWWRPDADRVITIVADPPPGPPVQLRTESGERNT
jgi:hypothetical protein